ncbi:hypothetical protein BOVA711_4939 [Bacteroides ovatus]|jgi:hypothetical protein|nr:hypothetical protein BOVA711_4939 [Bacteroides ovatus]
MAVLNVIVKTTPIMQVRILLPPQAFMMVEEEIGTNKLIHIRAAG